MSATTGAEARLQHLQLPGDFYAYESLLPQGEQELVLRLRTFLDERVRPVADDYWARAEFPMALIPGLAELDIVGGRPWWEGVRVGPLDRGAARAVTEKKGAAAGRD